MKAADPIAIPGKPSICRECGGEVYDVDEGECQGCKVRAEKTAAVMRAIGGPEVSAPRGYRRTRHGRTKKNRVRGGKNRSKTTRAFKGIVGG